jgi:hypothetical protein
VYVARIRGRGARLDSLFLPLTAAHCRPGLRLQVQRPEFINAEDDLRDFAPRGGLPVGDRVQLLDPAFFAAQHGSFDAFQVFSR